MEKEKENVDFIKILKVFLLTTKFYYSTGRKYNLFKYKLYLALYVLLKQFSVLTKLWLTVKKWIFSSNYNISKHVC